VRTDGRAAVVTKLASGMSVLNNL